MNKTYDWDATYRYPCWTQLGIEDWEERPDKVTEGLKGKGVALLKGKFGVLVLRTRDLKRRLQKVREGASKKLWCSIAGLSVCSLTVVVPYTRKVFYRKKK